MTAPFIVLYGFIAVWTVIAVAGIVVAVTSRRRAEP